MDFEIRFIEFLQAGRTPFFDLAFQMISEIGSVIGVVAFSLILLCFNRKMLFNYLVTYGFVYSLVEILKRTVQRVRPFNVSDTIVNIGDATTGFSFPSGHTACATALAVFLAYFLFQYYKKIPARIGIVVSCAIYVGLVALSRMYLGKHYFTDVLAGALISGAICAIGIVCVVLYKKRRRIGVDETKS